MWKWFASQLPINFKTLFIILTLSIRYPSLVSNLWTTGCFTFDSINCYQWEEKSFWKVEFFFNFELIFSDFTLLKKLLVCNAAFTLPCNRFPRSTKSARHRFRTGLERRGDTGATASRASLIQGLSTMAQGESKFRFQKYLISLKKKQ